MADNHLTTREKIIQLMTPVVFPLVRLYWFVFRPHTEGVKVVLQNDNDELLLVRHTYGSREWTLPGGGAEGDESPQETARREVKEELSAGVENVQVHGEFVSTKEYKHDHITVCSGRIKGAIKLSPFEIAEARWFEQESLPNMGSIAGQILSIYEQSN